MPEDLSRKKELLQHIMLFTLFAGESCLYSPLKKEKFMNKIKEYHYNQTNVAEWLPWGAITLPMVLEQKDRSYLGMIRYSLADKKDASFSCPAFRRGWTLVKDNTSIIS